MEREPQIGGSADQPSSPSTAVTIVWVLVAVLAHLALIDAAIETIWSGSPLRWWVAPGLLVFAALSAWLWRPGGGLLKRYGPATAAATPVMGFLAVLAITAWLPGGQATGVRMFLQPTPRLLTAALALVVLLAGIVLFRAAGSLSATPRLVARVFFTTLALYALVAFGLALRDNIPFTSLFQGGALWQRLPRWLQGTFVGVAALLPVGILVQFLRIIGGLRRKQPIRALVNQATALVMASVMAASGVLLPGASPSTATPAATADVTSAYTRLGASRREILDLMNAGDGTKGTSPSLEKVAAHTATLFGALDEVVAKLSRRTFDLDDVLAQAGSDTGALLQWVREQTGWVPYRGVLRGPQGVLMDRFGNSVDRALLLAALLKHAGRNARLAHAVLTPDQVARLHGRRQIASGAPQPTSEQASLDSGGEALVSVASALGMPSRQFRDLLESYDQSATVIWTNASEEAERQAASLLEVIGRHTVASSPEENLAEADHWWAQVEESGQWRDLDPDAETGTVGASGVQATETMTPERLPSDMFHAVRIRVVVERHANGRLEERVALDQGVRPFELFERSMTLVHVPLTLKPPAVPQKLGDLPAFVRQTAVREREWQPVLSIGDDVRPGAIVSTDGRVRDAAPESGQAENARPGASTAGDIGGLLGGSEEVKPPQDTKRDAEISREGEWTAEWVEYEIHVPGRPAETVRREVFDEIGPASRSRRADVSLTESQRADRAFALIGGTEILVLPCRLSTDYVAWLRATRMLANRQLLEFLTNTKPVSQQQTLEVVKRLVPLPGALYDFALARHALNPRRDDVFVASPNVVSLHRELKQSPDGAFLALTAVDVVANDVAPTAGVRDAFEARLRQGIFDTNAETLVLSGGCCGTNGSGTASAYTSAARSGVPWVLAATPESAAKLQIPDDARARILEELRTGYVIVAPPAASALDVAWWRIEPRSGRTLGIGSRGWGQETLEQALLRHKETAWMMSAVPHWVAYVAKFGLLVACALTYGVSSANQIAEGEGASGATTAAGVACILAGVFGINALFAGKLAPGLLARLVVLIIEALADANDWHHEHAEEKK
jgi:hypothetical protein